MLLAFGAGSGHQGSNVQPLGLPQHRTCDVDRIVQRKLIDDFDRCIAGGGQSPSELGACRHFQLVRQSLDHLAKDPDLIIGVSPGDQ